MLCAGLLMADVLQSVTKLLPLDQYAKYPVSQCFHNNIINNDFFV